MSNGAQPASGGATYRMLRELGSRAQHSYAAIRDPHELVVVQRFVRVRPGSDGVVAGAESGTPLEAEAMALLLRDARCLAKNWHPNIARVRHVDLASNELTIATEFLDGATLADLVEAAQPERTSPRDPLLAVPVLVRLLLDVLGGLNALHGLRDGMNTPVGAIHGELCPANVVIGKDGVTRIVNPLRKRPVRLDVGSEAVAYAPPEALDGSGTDDPRSDVYAVGVMLWEGLAGLRLFDETDPARVLARQREGDLTAPVIHPSSPFARLADTAMRALSFDPALRFRGPAEMAAEMRKIAGAKLASGSVVAARIADLAGDAMRMRRAMLEPALSGTRRRASERSILAAEASVEERAREERALESTPRPASTPRPLTRKARDPNVVRASPRVVAPTLATEIPVALIKASRRPSAPDLEEPNAMHADEGFAYEDDDELPGPRGSSPELDVAALLAQARATGAGAASDANASDARMVSPLTPNLPLPADAPAMEAAAIAIAIEVDIPPVPADISSTEVLIASALAATTAKMRAVAVERESERNLATKALPAPETPADFVIPIDVTATLNEAAPRQRRHLALVALSAALLLTAMGAFVAVRTGALRPEARSPSAASAPPPVAADDARPVIDGTAIVTTPTARAASTTALEAAPSGSTTANAAAPTDALANGSPASAAPPTSASASAGLAPVKAPGASPPGASPATAAPATRPKKSIYDPDAL